MILKNFTVQNWKKINLKILKVSFRPTKIVGYVSHRFSPSILDIYNDTVSNEVIKLENRRNFTQKIAHNKIVTANNVSIFTMESLLSSSMTLSKVENIFKIIKPIIKI